MKKETKKTTPTNRCVFVCGTDSEMKAIETYAKKFKTSPENFLLFLADNFINSK